MHFVILQLPAMNAYPERNSILVMDNCPIHRGGRIRQLCDARGQSVFAITIHSISRFLTQSACVNTGVRLVYLPPYCPELNPIEMCFSVVKSRFKRSGILETSGADADQPIRETVFETFTPLLMAEEYDGCGYALPDHMIEFY